MMNPTYAPPVSDLIVLGDVRGREKVDYLALGLTTEHVAELSRMALDDDLQWADSDSNEVWAPLHAWRALGQLRDPAGIAPLLEVMSYADEWEDDWSTSEPPVALAMIGKPAIEPLSLFLADPDQGLWSRGSAATALEKIGRRTS